MRCILVVDDEKNMRSMLCRSLNRGGYRTAGAEDGKVALQMLADGAYDLMITDIIMPEQEGIETIHQAKLKFPDLKIIAMTGDGFYGKEEYLEAAYTLGVSQVFHKPFLMKDLFLAVSELLA